MFIFPVLQGGKVQGFCTFLVAHVHKFMKDKTRIQTQVDRHLIYCSSLPLPPPSLIILSVLQSSYSCQNLEMIFGGIYPEGEI